MWNNEQLIPKTWIKEMSSPVIEKTPVGLAMGYYWWRDVEHNISSMDGHGGQFAFVVWPKDLLVVMTAFPNTQDDYQISIKEALPVVYRIMEITN